MKQPIYKNSWRWTCKRPKHVEAIYEKKNHSKIVCIKLVHLPYLYIWCTVTLTSNSVEFRRHSRRAYCFPRQGINAEVLLYILLEGFHTCSAIQVPQPRVRSAPQSPPSQHQTTQSHAGSSYMFKSNISLSGNVWVYFLTNLLTLSANFKQCIQKDHSVGSFFRYHQDPYEV